MTVPLTCRLLESKLLPRAEVATALRESVVRGISMVQALLESNTAAEAILNREFSRWTGPSLSSLQVDIELVQQLPLGMCERLLALPLVRAKSNAPVPLAVVDPFDSHVLSEFRFCLGLAVTPVRATYSLFVDALDSVRGEGRLVSDVLLDEREDETPAFGSRLLRAARHQRRTLEYIDGPPSTPSRRGFTLPPLESPAEPSEPPLPLVHTTMAPGPMVPYIPSAPRSPGNVVPGGNAELDSEPVLKLVKQKPSLAFRLSVPPPGGLSGKSEPPEVTLAGLSEAQTPQQLLERLQIALRETAPCQAFFSVRGSQFLLKWTRANVVSPAFEPTEEQRSLLRTACRAGYFLGPLPPDGTKKALGYVLGMRAREELYIAPVNVANRAALVLIVGRFDEAFTVTRWVDAVVKRASHVLEQMARAKKGS